MQNDWTKPAAVAIPKGGFFEDKVEQGRYGPIFPKTPACYGFSILAKIKPGMDKGDVRRVLGKPAKTAKFDLKPDEEHWDWRWLDGQVPKVFSVTFDRDGKVMASASMDDPAQGKVGQ